MRGFALLPLVLAFGLVLGQRLAPAVGRARPRIVSAAGVEHRHWFGKVFERASAIRVGTTRVEFDRLYKVAGGIQATPPTRYVLGELDLLHREVRWRFVKPPRRAPGGRVVQPENPRDTVAELGPVTVDWPAYD